MGVMILYKLDACRTNRAQTAQAFTVGADVLHYDMLGLGRAFEATLLRVAMGNRPLPNRVNI